MAKCSTRRSSNSRVECHDSPRAGRSRGPGRAIGERLCLQRGRLAMCRPMPWQPSIVQTRSGHRFASASIDRYPAAPVAYLPPPTTASSLAMTSIVAVRLCGSIPDHRCAHLVLPLVAAVPAERGGHRYFERRQTPLEPLLAHVRHPVRAGHVRATLNAGSRFASDEPGTWTEPRQAPVLGQVKQVAEMSAPLAISVG